MKHCIRCNKETNTFRMSWFNLDIICHDCAKEEKEHPLYQYAREKELEEARKGNTNYPGIFGELTWDEIKKKTTY